MKTYKVFTVNPGSTSTKIAVFDGEKKVYSANVSHDSKVLEEYKTLEDQLAYRKATIESLLKENHIDRYRHHIRMGQLHRKAQEVNEQVYEMLDSIMNRYLASHKPKDTNSTMEMWKLREQAKQLAEEVIYGEIVYQYH